MQTLNSKRVQLFLTCIAFTSLFLLAQKPLSSRHYDAGLHERRRQLQAITDDHCDGTLYRDLCVSTVASVPDVQSKSVSDVITYTLDRTAAAVRTSEENCTSYLHNRAWSLDPRQRHALADCLDLFDQTLGELRSAYKGLQSNDTARHIDDVQTALSAAITNQYTCLDGFAYVSGGGYRSAIERRLYHVSHLVSNSLAMLKKVKRRSGRSTGREALEGYGEVDDSGFPEWIGAKERLLLQAAANATSADLIVAKDGSGNFTTISDAVAAAPNNTKSRFVIYIKAGAYFENVEVGTNKINLMFIGDGIGKTLVKGNRNVVDGWTTFRSATIAVVGNGFLMRGITVENYAGASKHQAVALRVGADLSAFYKCSFVGYQDTLYVHSLRQFYRECDIYGTVDFIFGNAAVVFQKCNLYARQPMSNQQNIFTAQGREDPNQNTGISIQNCKVTAAADLIPVQSNFSTYLGRPWKQYSRTVYMQSFLDSLISPKGWLEWNDSFALDTLYYGEYKNRGPGSNTSRRVTWPGYRVIKSSAVAANFTAGNFIQGGMWLNGTSFPYYLGFN